MFIFLVFKLLRSGICGLPILPERSNKITSTASRKLRQDYQQTSRGRRNGEKLDRNSRKTKASDRHDGVFFSSGMDALVIGQLPRGEMSISI
jgi:hypothetical protein